MDNFFSIFKVRGSGKEYLTTVKERYYLKFD